MPLLTVTNISEEDVVLQSGDFKKHLKGGHNFTDVRLSVDTLRNLEPQLIELATRGVITWSRVADDPESPDDNPPSGGGAADEDVVLYVSASGNDSNDGLTVATPLFNFETALA